MTDRKAELEKLKKEDLVEAVLAAEERALEAEKRVAETIKTYEGAEQELTARFNAETSSLREKLAEAEAAAEKGQTALANAESVERFGRRAEEVRELLKAADKAAEDADQARRSAEGAMRELFALR